MDYVRSPFQDFESYLRIVVGSDEDDIQLILKQHNSYFVTYELPPGNYTIKDISEVVYTMGDYEVTLQTEYDDFAMKTKLILTRFGGTNGTLKLVEKSFFHALKMFTPYWDQKPTNALHADFPGVYTKNKVLKLSTVDKIHLKFGVIDGSVVNGSRRPILLSFFI